jgi:hypothetical protein
MAEYISGEKHRAMQAQQSQGTTITLPKPVIGIVAVVLLMGLSFYGGVAYQKGHQPKAAATASTAAGGTTRGSGFGGGRRFGGQRPTIGQVTAVSATSITVQDSNSGSSTTLSITSSTQITDNGQTVAASDITVGENVLIAASTSDKTQAARILVNPSFGGGGSSAQGSADNGSTSDGSTSTN